MKKLLFIFSLIFFITLQLSAGGRGWPDIRMAQPLMDVPWSPVQISVWPVSLVPAVDHTYTADIYGLNLNLTTLFHCQNNVYGLSCGVFQTYYAAWEKPFFSRGIRQKMDCCKTGFFATAP